MLDPCKASVDCIERVFRERFCFRVCCILNNPTYYSSLYWNFYFVELCNGDVSGHILKKTSWILVDICKINEIVFFAVIFQCNEMFLTRLILIKSDTSSTQFAFRKFCRRQCENCMNKDLLMIENGNDHSFVKFLRQMMIKWGYLFLQEKKLRHKLLILTATIALLAINLHF